MQFTQLIWYWWKFAKRPFRRSLPLAFFALLNLVVFAVAGVFSSQVTKAAGDETLVVSPNCGYWAADNGTSQQNLFAQSSKTLNDTITAASYARTCYGGLQDPLQCDIYTQPQIKWTTNHNASCPFATGVCYFSNTAAYEMDTGPIDSHDVLGINAPVRDRITYRKVTTCAPIHTRGFATQFNATGEPGTPGRQGDVIERLWYGPIVEVSNFTFQYNEHAVMDTFGYSLTYVFYTLRQCTLVLLIAISSSLEALGGYIGNTWLPVPELSRTNADISLFLLAPNSVRYDTRVDDPFFSAHLLGGSTISSGTNFTWYISDYFVNALACADQHQFCNPADNQCTELTSTTILEKQFLRIGLNAVQKMTGRRLLLDLGFTSTYLSVNGRGSSSLRAQETLYDLEQAPLPDNQWMIEVSSWFAVSMAKLQQSVVQYATGPPHLATGSHLFRPTDPINVAMCGSQKVRNSFNTISFSLLGVAIILIVGTMLILTNLILDLVVGWIQSRWNIGNYRHLQWISDDKLQLQRMAYEEAGIGTWSGTTSAVPVTKYGDRLGLPLNTDARHPRLSVRTSGKGEGDGLMGHDKGMWVETIEL